MKIAAVLLFALAALAAAETPRETCVRVYADGFNAATTFDERCAAAHMLSTCFANAVTDHNERILAQGFLDATQFNEDCSSYESAMVERVKIETADKSLKLGLGRGKDMVVSRPQDPEVISIWSVNNKVDALVADAAMKSDFTTLQATITQLQRAQGGIIDDIKDDLLDWVDTRLTAVETSIRASLAASLATLQNAANTLKTNFDDRVLALDTSINTTTSNIIRTVVTQIDANNTALLASLNKIMVDTNSTSTRITTLDTNINTKINTAVSAPRTSMDRVNLALNKTHFFDATLPIFRYAIWSTYSHYQSWMVDNNQLYFGGIAPSTWSDSNAIASSMSSDKNILRTLFTRKITPGWNANVFTNEWYSYSSTNGQMGGALFRIRNTAASVVNWTPFFYYSSYGGYNEYASVSLNGANSWSTSNSCGFCTASFALAMPANRVSTVIFIVGSSVPSGSRSTVLVFYQDSLKLPAGLEYVDDLDYATGGWEA